MALQNNLQDDDLFYDKLVTNSTVFHTANNNGLLKFHPCNRNPFTNVVVNKYLGRAEVVSMAKAVRPFHHSSLSPVFREFGPFGACQDSQTCVKTVLQKKPEAFVSVDRNWVAKTGSDPKWSTGTGTEKLESLGPPEGWNWNMAFLSSLVGMRMPAIFLEDGETSIRRGYMLGCSGARLNHVQMSRMDAQFCFITEAWHTEGNGYGKKGDKWLDTWTDALLPPTRDCFATYGYAAEQSSTGSKEKVVHGSAVIDETDGPNVDGYLDVEVYERRIRMTVEPFLCEAVACCNEDCVHQGIFSPSPARKAYCVVTSLGQEHWNLKGAAGSQQWKSLARVYATVLENMKDVHRIGCIDFFGFNKEFADELSRVCSSSSSDTAPADGNGDILQDGGLSYRGVRLRITGECALGAHAKAEHPSTVNEEKSASTLVIMYEWNAVTRTGDNSQDRGSPCSPKADFHSLTVDIQNPFVNPAINDLTTVGEHPYRSPESHETGRAAKVIRKMKDIVESSLKNQRRKHKASGRKGRS